MGDLFQAETEPTAAAQGAPKRAPKDKSAPSRAAKNKSAPSRAAKDKSAPKDKAAPARAPQNKKDKNAPSPMMAQYLALKAQHPDCLLFYRMGDFYELFLDDALAAAAALDIVLTHRGQLEGAPVPMCGVPVHSSQTYLHRLIRKGFKVAVCEQTEPQASQSARRSLMAREVVRLVTPGTLTEDNLLAPREHNYLAALAGGASGARALAWLDLSTGDFDVRVGSRADVLNELARVRPSELLLAPVLAGFAARAQSLVPSLSVSTMEVQSQDEGAALAEKYGGAVADAYGALDEPARAPCAMLLAYLQETQLDAQAALKPPQSGRAQMQIDAAARRNLELTTTQSGARAGSLLSLMDETSSAAGARLLAARLSAPLCDRLALEARLDGVAFFLARADLRARVRAQLQACPDLARALARLALGRAAPRDLGAVAEALDTADKIINLLQGEPLGGELEGARANLPTGTALGARLREALAAPLPATLGEGRLIAAGFHPPLDKARALRDERRRMIAALQARYQSQTQVKALKIKYHATLGYHVEVPLAHGDRLLREKLAQVFIHRQTLATAARFSTQELGGLAAEISGAADKIIALEKTLFEDLRAAVAADKPMLDALSEALAVLDVAAGLAELASQQQWVRPTLREDAELNLVGARHPAVERALGEEGGAPFIANDCALAGREKPARAPANQPCQIMLLTGPNMAGKSTYLRQAGLIVVLAQMGSFVPAQSASIGLVDKLFCRAGAGDELARGRSTFMVEMAETAVILREATPKSLVILDEIGRGTATFDGLAIAWAVVEHLHGALGARTLFATHYHELTALAARLDGLANYAMRVADEDGRIVFLHEVGKGAASQSYGVHVAELAGLPEAVTARARGLLEELEAQYRGKKTPAFLQDWKPPAAPQAHAAKPDALRAALLDLDPEALSARDALNLLYELRKHL